MTQNANFKLPPALVRVGRPWPRPSLCRCACAKALVKRLAMFVFEIGHAPRCADSCAPGVQFFGAVTVEGSETSTSARARAWDGAYLETSEGGRIRIGANCVINDGATIVAHRTSPSATLS